MRRGYVVVVDAYDQIVASRFGSLKECHVARVEEVKRAVNVDYFLAVFWLFKLHELLKHRGLVHKIDSFLVVRCMRFWIFEVENAAKYVRC